MAISRNEKITVLTLILTFLGMLAAWLVVPEFRKWVGLELGKTATNAIQIPKEPYPIEHKSTPALSSPSGNSIQNKKTIFNKDEFLIELDECTYLTANNFTVCTLKIVNTKHEDRFLVVHSVETLAVDSLGVDYSPFSIGFGSEFTHNQSIRKTMIYNSPLRARFSFEHRGDSQAFSLLRIVLESTNKKFNVEFRDVGINRK